MREAGRKAELEQLKVDSPELVERYEAERERAATLRHYLAPEGGYERTPGDPDLYKFFCQRYRDLLRTNGRIGVVLPRTAFQNQGSSGFRRWLFDHAAPTRIDFLLNKGRWAFDSEPRYTVALLAAERRSADSTDVLLVAGVASSAVEFVAQSNSPGIRVPSAALGAELEIPLLKTQDEANLLARLRTGKTFAFGGGRWKCFAVNELHETKDARHWTDARTGRPLWKGESFDQFDPQGAEARVCPASEEVLRKVRKSRPGAGSLLSDQISIADRLAAVARTVPRARVAFRLISRATDSRTVRACLVPPERFLVNSAPYLAFIDDAPACEAVCLALMNSLVFDWQARRFVEANMNHYILEGRWVPELDDETLTALAAAAARLSCQDERFADFAKATHVTVGVLDDGERVRLRILIDALVARAWGLTAAELELVFDDFTEDAVPPAYREAVRQRFAA